MGYAIMIELAEPFVCEIECEHEDCVYHREFVKNAKCKTCKKQIKSGNAYYGVEINNLIHFGCADK